MVHFKSNSTGNSPDNSPGNSPDNSPGNSPDNSRVSPPVNSLGDNSLGDRPLIALERLYEPPRRLVAGVDEVGRGALFGPVVSAAVTLAKDALEPLAAAGVTDSKLLSALRREQLAVTIQNLALDCQIGVASVREIDRLNILNASLLSMRRAVLRLTPLPDHCLIDGNQRVPNLEIPQTTLVKGDRHSIAIAAASIIAKVWRDRLITRLAVKYPQYDLVANKGYGTAKHRLALQQFGPSRQHRLSFSPCQLELQL